jgi:hypothetical protein
MKLNKYTIGILVVIGLILLSRVGCNNGFGFFDKPKADTVVVRDTVWNEHDSTIIRQMTIREVIYDIDTLPPQYLPDTNYAALKLQFEALVKEHASKNVYSDTLKLDTLGYIAVADTTQFNKLLNRSYDYKYKIPTITEQITITKYPTKRNQVYIGGAINVDAKLAPSTAEVGLILKTKRDQIMGVKAGSDINGNVNYGFQSYWKIGSKNR